MAFLIPAGPAVRAAAAYAEDQYCAEIQRLFSVPGDGDGVIKALRYVFGNSQDKSQADSAVKDFADWDKFAELVLVGSQPRILEIEILEHATVANIYSDAFQPPHWRLGNWVQRDNLLRRMRALAKQSQASDPTRAARLMRVAAVIAGQDWFQSSAAAFAVVQDPQCAEITSCDPKQLAALLRRITPDEQRTTDWYHRLSRIVDPLERLINYRIVDDEYRRQAADFLSHFPQTWSAAQSRHEGWRLANILWRFVCLSRANHDEGSMQEVRRLIDRLAPDTSDQFTRRWLTEALTIPGERPKDVGIRIIHDPNQLKPKGGP